MGSSFGNLKSEELKALEEEVKRLSKENEELKFVILSIKNCCEKLQEQTKMMERETEICSTSILKMETLRTNSYRVRVKTDPKDSTLIVEDGHEWRKYGQKITKDNPSPRAYFRCAKYPSCPVKKKVQRCAEDATMLEATYDGEHCHETAVNVDLTLSARSQEKKRTYESFSDVCSQNKEKKIMEEQVLSLTRDPGFTSALAGAVARYFIPLPRHTSE